MKQIFLLITFLAIGILSFKAQCYCEFTKTGVGYKSIIYSGDFQYPDDTYIAFTLEVKESETSSKDYVYYTFKFGDGDRERFKYIDVDISNIANREGLLKTCNYDGEDEKIGYYKDESAAMTKMLYEVLSFDNSPCSSITHDF